MIPAIGNGEDPLLVAVTAASFIFIVALFTTHGVTAMTSSAVLGTLVPRHHGAAGLVFTSAMHFTGLSERSTGSWSACCRTCSSRDCCSPA